MAAQTSDVMIVARSLRPDSDNLWAEAFNMLGDDLKTQINHTHDTKQDVLDKLLVTTEKARQGLRDKSWSYRRKNGEKVIVRDVLVKITEWVNRFKGVVDVAVSYDPVHAALPWAGVRFLLDVAMGDLTTYNELLDNTADVAEVICRNTLVERIIQNAQSETADELRRALTKLYASIMAYLPKAVAYYKQNTFKRVLHNGLLSSSDLNAASNAIKQAQDDLTRSSDAFGLSSQLQMQADLQEMLERFNAPVRRWDDTLHQMTDRIGRARRTAILSWISDEPYEMHHKLAYSEVLEGTGQWILCDPILLHWANESASSILWLHGIPGSGKSKLTSVVVSQALQAFREKLAPAPVYFYCSRNPAEPGRSDPPRILASIVRQLSTSSSSSSVLEPAVAVFTQREETAFASGPLHIDETKGLILQLLEKYKDATVTIVIDALDECNPGTRDILLDTLEYLLNASACLLKVFVSSRNDQDIVYSLQKYPNLTLSSDCNTADIELFGCEEVMAGYGEGGMIQWTFDSQVCFAISEAVLKAAAANKESGNKIMALLLDKRGDNIQITEEVVKAAAVNEESGTEIMALLLDKRGDDIQITEEVVKAAAANFNILELILDTRGRETIAVITRDTCLAAAACGYLDSLRALSDHIPLELVDPMWESIGIFYRSAVDGDVNWIEHLLSTNTPLDTKDTFG
ncbi:hypothetical protein CGCF413_v006068 [Colletotrichum fructicola]|nr:hypothetical protein CGCF413_v006068 [Colletotrichum fructicola]